MELRLEVTKFEVRFSAIFLGVQLNIIMWDFLFHLEIPLPLADLPHILLYDGTHPLDQFR